MKKNEYVSPEIEIVEIEMQSMIASSDYSGETPDINTDPNEELDT